MLPKITRQVGSINAVCPVGVESALNVFRAGAFARGLSCLVLPVLHHHGNAGSATAVLLLLDERNVQPLARRSRREQQDTGTHRQANQTL